MPRKKHYQSRLATGPKGCQSAKANNGPANQTTMANRIIPTIVRVIRFNNKRFNIVIFLRQKMLLAK